MNLLHHEKPDSDEIKLVDKLPNSFSPPTKSVITIDSKNQIWYLFIFKFIRLDIIIIF